MSLVSANIESLVYTPIMFVIGTKASQQYTPAMNLKKIAAMYPPNNQIST